jgi:glutamate N-acetyltransferase/amino-acid N-acetyltransferase
MKTSPLAPAALPALKPVKGVRIGAVAAGIRYKGRDDLTMAHVAPGSTVAGVFTTSRTCAPSILWSRAAANRAGGGGGFGLVVNAGNANAFTGAAGMAVVNETATAAAALLGCDAADVFVASTGVIGEPLDAGRLTAALPALHDGLSETGLAAAAQAIRTTDTFAKGASVETQIGGKTVTITGIAKGSGMIEPNMATMLGFIFTDAAIAQGALQEVLSALNEESFNAITVDSDTSTSDMLLLFATAKAGNDLVDKADDPALADFREALKVVMVDLATQIVKDGEGATKFVTIDVTGAESDTAAKRIAKAIANSPLVKTAIAGEDANWGRIVAAAGKAGEAVDPEKLVIRFGGTVVTENGARVAGYDESKLDAHLKGHYIDIAVDLGLGAGQARVWTCDLTHGYIDINADYRS